MTTGRPSAPLRLAVALGAAALQLAALAPAWAGGGGPCAGCFAVVRGDGSLDRGAFVLSTARLGTGRYWVEFQGRVDACALATTHGADRVGDGGARRAAARHLGERRHLRRPGPARGPDLPPRRDLLIPAPPSPDPVTGAGPPPNTARRRQPVRGRMAARPAREDRPLGRPPRAGGAGRPTARAARRPRPRRVRDVAGSGRRVRRLPRRQPLRAPSRLPPLLEPLLRRAGRAV